MPLKQLQEGFENYLNSKSLEKSEFDKKMKGIFDLLDTNKNDFNYYEEFFRGVSINNYLLIKMLCNLLLISLINKVRGILIFKI